MAGSRRKLIRSTLRDFLKGKTDAGDNVFTNTASASWSEQLPLIAIYARSEDVELFAVSPREYKRTLHLMIEVIVQGAESADPAQEVAAEDALDDILAQIEKAIAPDETLGEIPDEFRDGKMLCLVDELLLKNVEFTFRGEGEKPQAAAVMHYSAVYYAYEPVNLSEQDGVGKFKKANVQWPQGPVVPGHTQQENFEIEDDLTIPD